MSRVPLGHLRRLNPRDAWANEATDFTPWLAQEANFQALADTLHFVEPEILHEEHRIGDFYADIVAKDRDGLILIENQLEQTDHSHLGQVLTYLAGLDGPAKVVWISTKVREEHRAAIDWLNANTPSDYAFFAVELEVFQIGDGPAAPHFHVAARPNEWSRHVSARNRQINNEGLGEAAQIYKALWTGLQEHLRDHDPDFRERQPPPQHWWPFPIGRSGFHLTTVASVREVQIGVELYCQRDPSKAVFDHLFKDRADVDVEFGEPLSWERLDDKLGWRVIIRKTNAPPNERERWTEYFAWYLDQLTRFRRTFKARLAELEVDALQGLADEESE